MLKCSLERLPLLNGMYSSYVDEAQDNLLIDALCTILVYLLFSHLMFVSVLRIICGNPEGLFWACDTVEMISGGSTFRFNDLKAFLHRLEVSACLLM